MSAKTVSGYLAVMDEAEKPLADRRKMVKGREGKVIPRKFHLSEAEIDQLAAAHRDGDKLPNPHNKGAYYYLIEALKSLGLRQKHSIAELTAKVRELMSDKATIQEDAKGNKSNAWQRFNRKTPRNDETGLDVHGRIRQNLEVLQRVNMSSLTPYGLKLLQVGTKVLKSNGVVIDILRGGEEDKEVFVRLNTDAATPTNEFRRARQPSETKPAKKSKPKAKKASKPKVRKAKAVATPAAEPATATAAPADGGTGNAAE